LTSHIRTVENNSWVREMAGFTASEWIARPPDQVFAYSVDAANAAKWLRDVEKVEPVTEGPLRVGTRLRGTRLLGGAERGGTRVDLEALFRAKSLAARMTVAMIARQMDLHDGGQLRDLKAAIESES
jgi:hypothetical protein